MPKDERGKRGGLLIGVVGPCGSGKSTLIAGLEREGYACRHIAQEHSYVQDMWKRITDPDLLIFLHCSFETATSRRSLNWTRADYEEELRRLAHARSHANLLIETDEIPIELVRSRALDFLRSIESG